MSNVDQIEREFKMVSWNFSLFFRIPYPSTNFNKLVKQNIGVMIDNESNSVQNIC